MTTATPPAQRASSGAPNASVRARIIQFERLRNEVYEIIKGGDLATILGRALDDPLAGKFVARLTFCCSTRHAAARGGSYYYAQQAIWQDIAVGRKPMDRIRPMLQARGIIEATKAGQNNTWHYHLRWRALIDLLKRFLGITPDAPPRTRAQSKKKENGTNRSVPLEGQSLLPSSSPPLACPLSLRNSEDPQAKPEAPRSSGDDKQGPKAGETDERNEPQDDKPTDQEQEAPAFREAYAAMLKVDIWPSVAVHLIRRLGPAQALRELRAAEKRCSKPIPREKRGAYYAKCVANARLSRQEEAAVEHSAEKDKARAARVVAAPRSTVHTRPAAPPVQTARPESAATGAPKDGRGEFGPGSEFWEGMRVRMQRECHTLPPRAGRKQDDRESAKLAGLRPNLVETKSAVPPARRAVSQTEDDIRRLSHTHDTHNGGLGAQLGT